MKTGYQEPEMKEQEVSEEDPNKEPGKKVVQEKPEDHKDDEYLDLGKGLEEEEFMVVKELPVQQVRKVKDEKTGKVTNLVTTEEALSNLINQSDKNFEDLTGGL